MRENLTLMFCLLAGFALLFGRHHVPANLMQSYDAFVQAQGRDDERRAVRFGELALQAAEKSALLDAAGRARLAVQVGEAHAKAGNPQRAYELYVQAVEGLNDGAHNPELVQARSLLARIEARLADGSALRGTQASTRPGT